uniref:Helicase-associated domain-containing protein n=1 Tax=Leptocylindrus danicus TaxID=163516 RepID=A0A7S2JY20_9STRA|mmetsp:Transcript_14118/g.20881  ORF Transcript_14118/g.20881 Transcript_14118/m.20881 type:complete len:505 (+) Transcript_14118:136-1650(+)|eukprot:CAMPEP_0116008614 /NCGR_PEP_ID=MMETSP0321-20121206/2957_1 /TAXON_ID=163516 /ORGANISM="Leptocylindrus danicus var. danicus, Strain B650" /LENGTH=504 /DNA_ID=CAMNT_0003477449 /DNA_START=108 /DNA_END=1622 /DNA_ORIENTATION=+
MATQQNKDTTVPNEDEPDISRDLIPPFALGTVSFLSTYLDRRDKTNAEVDERYGKKPKKDKNKRKREPKPKPAQLLNESDLEDDEDELFQHFLMQHNTQFEKDDDSDEESESEDDDENSQSEDPNLRLLEEVPVDEEVEEEVQDDDDCADDMFKHFTTYQDTIDHEEEERKRKKAEDDAQKKMVNHKNNLETRWNENYEKLVAYKEKYGDCEVPQTYPGSLGGWVNQQRRAYKLLQTNKIAKSNLVNIENRVAKLKELNFTWVLPRGGKPNRGENKRTKYSEEELAETRTEKNRRPPTAKQEKHWMEQFHQLRQFKNRFDSFDVPADYNKSLMLWARTQRRHYKLLKEGKYSIMTGDRIKKLEGIGFDFVLLTANGEPRKPRGICADGKPSASKKTPLEKREDYLKREEEKWMKMFEALKLYKSIHGDFTVPGSYKKEPKLLQWCHYQRKQWRNGREGVDSNLTVEHRKLLDGIGFPWEISRRQSSRLSKRPTDLFIMGFNVKK